MRTRNTRNVESTFGEEFSSNEFTVAVTGKTFDILLDQLYENKVRACIRELWTNAFDAHVAAGVGDQPFFCQLPTELDGTFSVRDYGVSMTDDEVRHLYTTVFASSKTDGERADDFVGSLGLGSKAPFAYTDAFTVTVWLDGEQRTYLCSRGADGIPTITHLSTEPSDQPRGVEVSFPVQAQHFREFETEAHHVALGFDVKPTVPGVEFKTDTAVFKGDTWQVIEDRQHGIRQGCVIYPVHDYVVPGIRYGFGLIVDVPIGTCDIAANREALSMDDITRRNVHLALERATTELEATVRDHITAAPDAFTANERYVRLCHAFSLGKVHYHGQVLTGVITFKQDDKRNTPQTILDGKLKAVGGHLHVSVSEATHVTFVVDRSDLPSQRPMPRKLTRFRRWRDHQGGKVLVLRDPTTRQLAHLVRRLHLRGDQIVAMRGLPDVKIERLPRKKKESVAIGGLMQLNATRDHHDNTIVPVKELPNDYLWLQVDRWDGRDWDLGEFGYRSRGEAQTWITRLIELTGTVKPVLAMTAGAVKRFKPDPAANFLTVAHDWIKANTEVALAAYKVTKVFREVNTRASSYLTDKVIVAMLLEDFPDVKLGKGGYDFTLLSIMQRVVPKELAKVNAEAVSLVDAAQKRYPLCFGAREEEQLLTYVSLT